MILPETNIADRVPMPPVREPAEEMLIRSTSMPTSIDPEARTFWATVATKTPVKRSDARGAYAEVLDTDQLDPASLIGLPALDWHGSGSVNKVLGRVIDARRAADGSIEAKFQISSAEPKVMTKVAEGDIAGTSVGYSVQSWAETTNNGIRTRTARQWRVREISLTPSPADPRCIIRSEETPMTLDTETGATAGADQSQTTETVNRAGLNAQIRSIAELAGLDRSWGDAQIDAGATDLHAVRSAAFGEMTTKRGNRSLAGFQVVQDHNDPVQVRSAMADALAGRLDPSCKIEGRAREYAGWSLLDMGAELARHRGEKVDSRNRNAAADFLTRSGGGHSTSDFPLLLENALNKSVLPRYQAAAPSYKEWSAPMSFNDFRAHKSLRLGDFPTLKEVTAESGEVQYGTISENRETITAKEFASGISITRRALVNDDLGQLSDFTALIGQRVASDENAWMYTALAANAVLSDSVALFHATHANLAGSAAAISVTSIGLAMAAVRKQKSLDGIYLNLAPSILLVGPAIETVARQFLTQVSPQTTAAANPWAGAFKLVVDANITDNAWYLFCDPNAAPVFKHGYVQGTGPVVRSEIDFDTRGLRVVVGLDFGYGAVDFRGAYRNAGA